MSVYIDSINASAAAPATKLSTITPHDTNKVPQDTKALYIGSGGSLRMQARDDADGESVTFVNIPQGAILDVRPLRVFATGTTASNIIALR